MQKNDGMNYAPKGKPNPVVGPGEFVIAAVALDHGHIYGMVNGLIEAGATLKWVYDRDRAKAEAFARTYPQVTIAASEEEILADPQVQLVAGAAVTSERCALGLRVMDAGKDYFTDKAPLQRLSSWSRPAPKCVKPEESIWFITAKGCMSNRRFMPGSSLSRARSGGCCR